MRGLVRGLLVVLAVVAAVALSVRLRVALGLPEARVTSWWRTPWHNQEVGGHPRSLHLWGWAVDMVPAPGSGLTLAELARRARALFPVVVYGTPDHRDHVHAQL